MNKKFLLLSLLLCISAVAFAQPRPGGWATKQNTVLYEGKYTETGSFYVNETQSQQFINSSSFYAKIYADKMIVTAIPFGRLSLGILNSNIKATAMAAAYIHFRMAPCSIKSIKITI